MEPFGRIAAERKTKEEQSYSSILRRQEGTARANHDDQQEAALQQISRALPRLRSIIVVQLVQLRRQESKPQPPPDQTEQPDSQNPLLFF